MSPITFDGFRLEFTAIDDEVAVKVNDKRTWGHKILRPHTETAVYKLSEDLTKAKNKVEIVAYNGPGAAALVGRLIGSTGKTDRELISWNERIGHHHGANHQVFFTETIVLPKTGESPLRAETLTLTFTEIDDQLMVRLNNEDVKDFKVDWNQRPEPYEYHRSPTFGLQKDTGAMVFDLSGRLKPGPNRLEVKARNISGYGALVGKIEADGHEIRRWTTTGFEVETGFFIDDVFEIEH